MYIVDAGSNGNKLYRYKKNDLSAKKSVMEWYDDCPEMEKGWKEERKELARANANAKDSKDKTDKGDGAAGGSDGRGSKGGSGDGGGADGGIHT